MKAYGDVAASGDEGFTRRSRRGLGEEWDAGYGDGGEWDDGDGKEWDAINIFSF